MNYFEDKEDGIELSGKEKLSETIATGLCLLMLIGFLLKILFF